MKATVTVLKPRPDPAIAEVVRLMEETDEAGRVKVLEAVKAVLAFYDPPVREGRILQFRIPGE
jgi:hypothetical protein